MTEEFEKALIAAGWERNVFQGMSLVNGEAYSKKLDGEIFAMIGSVYDRYERISVRINRAVDGVVVYAAQFTVRRPSESIADLEKAIVDIVKAIATIERLA